MGKLQEAIATDLLLHSTVKNPAKLRDRALLWLHEQDVIRLNKGLAVFRPAMTIRLGKDKRTFVKADKGPYLLISKEMLSLCMDEKVKKFSLKKKKRKGRKK